MSEAVFKLLQVFGDLTQRNLIALELSEKIPTLVDMLHEEIDAAKQIFERQQVFDYLVFFKVFYVLGSKSKRR